jgi:hypothetical protein
MTFELPNIFSPLQDFLPQTLDQPHNVSDFACVNLKSSIRFVGAYSGRKNSDLIPLSINSVHHGIYTDQVRGWRVGVRYINVSGFNYYLGINYSSNIHQIRNLQETLYLQRGESNSRSPTVTEEENRNLCICRTWTPG